MEIRPASIEQFLATEKGDLVGIDDDVGGFAQQLVEVDPSLRLRYSIRGEYFVVYQELEQPDGAIDHQLVTTAQELDGRLIARVREVTHESYDLGREADKLQDQKVRDHERAISNKIGDIGEQLAFALRRDLGLKRNL